MNHVKDDWSRDFVPTPRGEDDLAATNKLSSPAPAAWDLVDRRGSGRGSRRGCWLMEKATKSTKLISWLGPCKGEEGLLPKKRLGEEWQGAPSWFACAFMPASDTLP